VRQGKQAAVKAVTEPDASGKRRHHHQKTIHRRGRTCRQGEGTHSPALAYRLVNKVVPVELYLEEAVKLASEIAAQSPIAVRLAKEAINHVDDSHLSEGLHFERKNFYLLFATEDQTEGMQAFIEKRVPNFTGK
jgi:1,4-dihydroxy-2-naphthoyl-CoA synthase